MTQPIPSSLTSSARAASRVRLLLAITLALTSAGLSACAPASRPATAQATGAAAERDGDHAAAEESPASESVGYADDEGGASDAEAPTASPTDVSSAEGSFETLLQTEQQYLTLMDGSAPDCDQAERLVQRICLLATRVCSLGGSEGDASCEDARGRCAGAEARLGRACSSALRD